MLKAVLTIVHGTDSFPGSEQYYIKFTSDTRRGNLEYHLAKHLSSGSFAQVAASGIDEATKEWVLKVDQFVRQIAQHNFADRVPNVEVKFMKPKGALVKN